MQIIISLFYFFFFCALLYKIPYFRNILGLPYPLLVVFFTAKVFAGMVLILVYTYYYTDPAYADVYKYYYDGRIMFLSIMDNPVDYFRMLTGIDASAVHLNQYYEQMSFWHRPFVTAGYNDSRLVIRFNAFVSLFSMGYLQVHNVFINFLSLSGLVALYRFFIKYTDPGKAGWIALGIFLMPGILFWGSGVLKEGLLLWAFGFWIFYVDRMLSNDNSRLWDAILLILYSFLLILLKPYTLFLWIPCMAAFYISRRWSPLKINLTYMGILLLCVAGALILGMIKPEYDLVSIIAEKQNHFIIHSLHEDAGSLIHTHSLSPAIMEVIPAFFTGIIHALFRPHLLEVYSVVTLMAALENLMILLLMVYMVFYFDRESFTKYPVKWSGIWFSLLLLGFIGMISVAYGGIVRYRMPALPFLMMFVIQMARLPLWNPATLFPLKYFKKEDELL